VQRILSLVAAMVLVLVGAGPAQAERDDGIDWGVANWAAGVQMATSWPSVSDPYLHLRFKRVGGEGQRQVRMGERHKVEGTRTWGRYRFTEPVKLRVGEKVVLTTERPVACEPPKAPLGIVAQMRIKPPGKPWSGWETWISEDHILPDCTGTQ